MSEKRIAVTLPAGPRISDTVDRIRWAEENGIPDAWFSDSGAPDTLTQVAGHCASAHIQHSYWYGGHAGVYPLAFRVGCFG